MVGRRALLAYGVALGLAVRGASRGRPPSRAQSYPDKPIKMIVPFPAGGPIDTMARLTAGDLGNRLGQQVIVENRPGAGSTIGFKAAATAEPDGYTLLFGPSGLLGVAPRALSEPRRRSAQAFHRGRDHVAAAARHGGRPVPCRPKTVAEFVAYAKANPGKLNYGAGLGTPAASPLDAVQDPGRPRRHLRALQGLGAVGDGSPRRPDPLHHRRHADPRFRRSSRASCARSLAARPERWPDLPDVPTFLESGFPDLIIDAWTGVVAPKGTPAPIIEKLNAAINEGLRTTEIKTALGHFSALPEGQHARRVRRLPPRPAAEMGRDGEARPRAR